VSELLEGWARDTAADQPAVHIVGEQNSARAHRLRDVLTRNGIPFEFCSPESDRGRLLLEMSSQSRTAPAVDAPVALRTGFVAAVSSRHVSTGQPGGQQSAARNLDDCRRQQPSSQPHWRSGRPQHPADLGIIPMA
jgi:hypothetical protein